jgi:hypothetical protein
VGPSSITNPSHASDYNRILVPSMTDTIAITAVKPQHIVNSRFLYLLAEGDQDTRITDLDARENVWLIEDPRNQKMAVRFGAFYTSLIEVKIYDEDRKLVFWEKRSEAFSGEQILVDYHAFEGGKYFLHVNTNDGTVITQHIYKPFQSYTAAN